jgi:hypothetical protein
MSDLYDHVLSKPELRRSKPGRAGFAAKSGRRPFQEGQAAAEVE